jgi:hypothetical protein
VKLDGATQLDRGIIGWIGHTAKRNKARLGMAYDDLVQEGFVCYVKCRNHYAGKITSRRHFMALVQTAYRRRLTDLAHNRMKDVTVSFAELLPLTALDDALESVLLRHGASPATPPELPEAAATFASLPSEIKTLLLLFVNDLPRFERQGTRGRRETTHEYHCRLAGVNPRDADLSLETIRHMIA